MKSFFNFFILLLILTSCKENKIKKSQHEKTFNDYSELLDHAASKDSQKFNSKLKEMNLEDNFHLQKFNKLYSEQKAIAECNTLLLEENYTAAKKLINQQIKTHGISPLLQDTKDTIYSLEQFQALKKELPALSPKVALRRLNEAKTKLKTIFSATPDNKALKNWFNAEFQRIARLNYLKNSQVVDINLLQIDQANLALDLETKRGAELFYLEVKINKNSKQKALANRLINLNQTSSQKALCLTDSIMQTYLNTQSFSVVKILTKIKRINAISPVAKQLKHRIIAKALKDKNINLNTLENKAYMDVTSFMDISLKSTE